MVAYLNMDVAGGMRFSAGAVPSLGQLALDVAKQAAGPYTGTSVYNNWSDRVGRLGSGSDDTGYIDRSTTEQPRTANRTTR